MKLNFTKSSFLRKAIIAIAAPFVFSTSFAQPVASLVVGTGTTVSTGTPMPYYTGWWGVKNQYIVTAAELTALGAIPGDISGIGFDVTTTGGMAMTNFTVKIGATSLTAATTTWVTTGLATVYTNASFTPVGNTVNMHNFTTPFTWNGTSNIIIETCFNNSAYSGGHGVKYHTAPFTSTHYVYDDLSTVCSSPNTGYTSTMRPNIHFDFIVPPNNTGITAITAPSTAAFCSGIKEIKANIHNFGSNTISGVTVNWKVNGVLQAPVTYATLIDMENTTSGPDAEVSLGNWEFPHNTPQTIQAWTSMPNNVQDTKISNDSSSRVVTATLLGINDLEITPQDTTICIGSTISLDAGTHPLNPIFIWSNGVITQENSINTAGTYSVFVQNTDGCSAKDTVSIGVHPNPVANSIAINDLGNGSFQFGILGGYNIDTYNWNFGDGTQQSGGSTMTKQYATSGEYTVTVTMSNQCGEITIVRVLAVVVGNGTGVNDLKGLANDLKMYPNPGRDKVIITHNGGIKMKHVELYNLMGQKVYSEAVNAEKQEINISNLASGIYNVVIDTDKGKATKKLEVIR